MIGTKRPSKCYRWTWAEISAVDREAAASERCRHLASAVVVGMTKKQLLSKSVLVTGASGGIGRATAIAFADAGFRVGVHFNRGEERAKETCSRLSGDGHCLLSGDLTDPRAVQNLHTAAIAQLGCIDVLVNNAGIGERHPFDECDYDTWNAAWHRTINANLIGPANLMYCVSRQMVRDGGGRIVNVSSRGAFVGEPEQPWYGASKAGLNSMGQSLARVLAAKGVFVFAVAPGFVETPMSERALGGKNGERIRSESPLGRVATADEVATSILVNRRGVKSSIGVE